MPERIEFQILDVSYEIIEGEPKILLWSRLHDGRRVAILHKGFRPYFYAIVEEGLDIEDVREKIRRLSKPKSPIVSVETVERRYFGRPVKALKITTVIPEYVREYREGVAKINGIKKVLEADIRFSLRFLIDKNLYPLRWYEASVTETKIRWYRVDSVYELEEDPKEVISGERADPLNGLNVMAFDIEVYSPQRSPDPSRDPIVLIALQFNEEEPIVLEAEGKGDANLIKKFVDIVLKKDPDIIVGYNSNRFDWPYLLERSKINGVKLDVTRRTGTIPQPSVYGHISVPGRLNVDLLDFAEELHEIKMKTLEEVADYLGVMPKDKRTNLEWWQISEYWDDLNKRPILKKYVKDDVISTMGLAGKFLPFGAQLSQVSGLPMDQIMAASVGFRLEWRLIREAYKLGELVPNRLERREEKYTGAVVLQPLKGVHEDIAVLDFASMYPNIMVRYNVGPDTIIRPEESYEPEKVYIAPEVGHRFRKEPNGFFRRVLSRFLEWRKRIKREMKNFDSESAEYRLLNERQKAIKVLANASYGYMGWNGARWYCRECAEAVTAWGRNLIKNSIALAKSLGLRVIYGDTDSLFVKYEKDIIKRLIEKIDNDLGFEVKIDKIYKRVFFTEAKKRYAGLTIDDKIDVVGFEAVRGDWSELAKETQLKVMETILKTGNVDDAINYVKNIITSLRNGEIPIEKLIIWKTLTKRAEEYEANAPHVAAAKIMMKLGYRIYPGMKVGFVVTKGSGKISNRAKPYFIVKQNEIDFDYYINKQIIPATLRILGYFGVSEKKLKSITGGKQKSLLDYFG